MTEQMQIVCDTFRAKRDRGIDQETLHVWAKVVEGFSVEQVQDAADKIIAKETKGRIEPGDFARELGKYSKAMKRLRWWHQSGEWGGPWNEASKESLLLVAAHMVLDARGNERDTYRVRREAFLKACDKKGLPAFIVNQAANELAKSHQHLDDYIASELGTHVQKELAS